MYYYIHGLMKTHVVPTGILVPSSLPPRSTHKHWGTLWLGLFVLDVERQFGNDRLTPRPHRACRS